MASRNKYHGYVKLPKKKTSKHWIHFDFNGQITAQQKNAKLEGFWIRMFVQKQPFEKIEPEIGVRLTPEQWLDLIDAMRAEFESFQKRRKELDDM